MSAPPRVVVALDFASAEEALAFAARLRPTQCRLKVGLELYMAAGPAIVERLVEQGFDVFLDLKFHDIPNTVARACERAAALGVWMLNVHALGGPAMLRAARAACARAARPPRLIAVTVLTSHSGAELEAIGLGGGGGGDTASLVERLATVAHEAGLDGVVCAPSEAARLRQRFGENFLLVTPGIRPSGSNEDDQHRTATPATARHAGADYLVVGRPITRAPDPLAALDAVRREIGEI